MPSRGDEEADADTENTAHDCAFRQPFSQGVNAECADDCAQQNLGQKLNDELENYSVPLQMTDFPDLITA